MKKFSIVMLLTLLALGAGAAAQDAPSDEALLQAMDEARFLSTESFTMTVEVVADRPDGSEQALVQLFFSQIDGEDVARIEFLQPEDMAGEVFLTTPEGTFLWNPDLITPLKTSGQQAVFGDASVAETVGIQFAGNYDVVAREEVTLEDGTEGLRVELEDPNKDVQGAEKQAFTGVSVRVERQTLRPRSMRLFALSGDAINDVTFEEYGELDGDVYVVGQLIESQIVDANKTLLTITSISAEALSPDLFDPSKLGQEN